MPGTRRTPAKPASSGVKGIFEVHSDKKHSVRFSPSDRAAGQMLSTIYVNNTALAAIGYEDGQQIQVTIDLV